MMANRSAELALCRAELRAGASTQARHLARAMLTDRGAQLAWLQRWHQTMDHTGHNGIETGKPGASGTSSKYGLAGDNLVSAEILLAGRSTIRARKRVQPYPAVIRSVA